MPKKIQMERPAIVDGIAYGRNGVYKVSDKVGRGLVQSKKARVIENLGEDPKDAADIDPTFLEQIRIHAKQIMEILNEEYEKHQESARAESESNINRRMDQGIEEKPDPDVPTGASNEEESKGNQLEDSGNTQGEAAGTPIPDHFPGRKFLMENTDEDGNPNPYDTIEKIPQDQAKLEAVKGIGPRLAQQIGAAMVERGYWSGE